MGYLIYIVHWLYIVENILIGVLQQRLEKYARFNSRGIEYETVLVCTYMNSLNNSFRPK